MARWSRTSPEPGVSSATDRSDPLWLERLAIGDELALGTVVCSSAAIDGYAAATGDDHPIHSNRDAARQLGFADRIAQGPLPLGFALSALARRLGPSVRTLLSVDAWAFKAPAVADVALDGRARVASIGPARRSGTPVTFDLDLVEQSGRVVQSGRATLLVRADPAGAAAAPAAAWRELASGLAFPEGPVALPNGDLLMVEVAAGRVTVVGGGLAPSGELRVVARPGGGPNGAARGPDGRIYLCNNGGLEWLERDGVLYPGHARPDAVGRIEALDLATGAVERLFDSCDGQPLLGPNDLVFDRQGGLWFTDHGRRQERTRQAGAVYYADLGQRSVRRIATGIEQPNGIGLSPDETRLYVAETPTGRLWVFELEAPGRLARQRQAVPWLRGRILLGSTDYRLFDSLAVEAGGDVCVGCCGEGGIAVAAQAGGLRAFLPLPDLFVTNLCFAGPGLRTAAITLSGSGRLVAQPWARPGLEPNFAGAV